MKRTDNGVKVLDTDSPTVKVLALGPAAFAVAERRAGSWRVEGGGPAGAGGSWAHASIERLSRDVAAEHAAHQHVTVYPTASEAASVCGAEVDA